MPIPQGITLQEIPPLCPNAINQYNNQGGRYNQAYAQFLQSRSDGMTAQGNLADWVTTEAAAGAIRQLLTQFGMGGRGEPLNTVQEIQGVLAGLDQEIVSWVAQFTLPLAQAPSQLAHPKRNRTLANALIQMYDTLGRQGALWRPGGFVIASKTMHCLFPNLAPMIDRTHSGMSYYHIERNTYLPPLGLQNWDEWIGLPLGGVPNPSPQGDGARNWTATRFVAAIGINQSIYELWQAANGNPGPNGFLGLDQGATGIPRVIDKVLW